MEKEKIIVNEMLSQAVLEQILREADFMQYLKKAQDTGDILQFSDEELRFYGTVPNEETLEKLRRANELLDVIETGPFLRVEKFREPEPECNTGFAVITVGKHLGAFNGTVHKAFKELVCLSDEVSLLYREECGIRISFHFRNLWKESRLMTDEEYEDWMSDSEAAEGGREELEAAEGGSEE